MELDSLSAAAIEEYPWESETQKEGFLNYLQYAKSLGLQLALPIGNNYSLGIYLIQKEHEAAEYWTQTFGDHVSRLENEIKRLQDKLNHIEKLQDSQGQSIALLIGPTKSP